MAGDRCDFCRCRSTEQPTHKEGCPALIDKRNSEREWHEGYYHGGYDYHDLSEFKNCTPSFKLGYRVGANDRVVENELAEAQRHEDMFNEDMLRDFGE